jgi:putative peptidoglycan lipid II flippase
MSLARATLLLLALALLSRVFGLVREMVIAWRFGASAETDAFFVAFSIPYAFYTVVGMSLTAVIVPILADYEAQGRPDEAMRMASLVINVVLISIGALAVAGIVGAPQVAWVLGGGFDEATLKLAAQFTALMMPSIVFMSVAGVLAGILNNRHVFGAPAFGPVAMNLVIIMGAIIGGAWAGIQGLVVGTVLGALSFALVQLPALRRIGYRHRWAFSLNDKAIVRIAVIIWPVMLVSGFSFLYTLIDFRLASGLTEGSITALNYANKFIQLPQGLFVLAVTTAIFPTLSKLAANARQEEMIALLSKGLRMILLLAVPGTVGLIVVGQSLVELLFQRGAFGTHAAAMTSSALLFLTIGLVGFCVNVPLIRGFYASQDRRTPLLVGLLSVGVKLLLSLGLVRVLQHNGLALATSITILLNASVLAFYLQRKLCGLFDASFFSFVMRLLVAAGVMGLVVFVLDKALVSHLPSGVMMLAGGVLLEVIVGIAAFASMAWLLRLDELRGVITQTSSIMKRRLKEA